MKISPVFLVPLFICFLSVLPMSTLMADEAVTFVDLDGDGFNDNEPDSDNNNIPDIAEGKQDQTTDSAEGENSFGGFQAIQAPCSIDYEAMLPNSERFGKLQFSTRGHVSLRGGFDSESDFGPGNGIGCGGISGCAGGVCH